MDLNQQLIIDFANGKGIFADGDASLSAEDVKECREYVKFARDCHSAAKNETDPNERQRLIDTVDKNLMAANAIREKNGLAEITTPEKTLTQEELEAEDDAAVEEMLALAGNPAANIGGV